MLNNSPHLQRKKEQSPIDAYDATPPKSSSVHSLAIDGHSQKYALKRKDTVLYFDAFDDHRS